MRLVQAHRRRWEGHLVNRVYDVPQGHAGARERLAAWAVRHQVRVVERKEVVQRAG